MSPNGSEPVGAPTAQEALMNNHPTVMLDLEVQEIERKGKPGCTSSSTSNRCTCPVLVANNAD